MLGEGLPADAIGILICQPSVLYIKAFQRLWNRLKGEFLALIQLRSAQQRLDSRPDAGHKTGSAEFDLNPSWSLAKALVVSWIVNAAFHLLRNLYVSTYASRHDGESQDFVAALLIGQAFFGLWAPAETTVVLGAALLCGAGGVHLLRSPLWPPHLPSRPCCSHNFSARIFLFQKKIEKPR